MKYQNRSEAEQKEKIKTSKASITRVNGNNTDRKKKKPIRKCNSSQ